MIYATANAFRFFKKRFFAHVLLNRDLRQRGKLCMHVIILISKKTLIFNGNYKSKEIASCLTFYTEHIMPFEFQRFLKYCFCFVNHFENFKTKIKGTYQSKRLPVVCDVKTEHNIMSFWFRKNISIIWSVLRESPPFCVDKE